MPFGQVAKLPNDGLACQVLQGSRHQAATGQGLAKRSLWQASRATEVGRCHGGHPPRS